MLAAVLLSLIGSRLDLPGVTDAINSSQAAGSMTLTGYWYWIVCMTVFRFLMLRWIWRLGMWVSLLVCVARLKLRLVPTHPDGAAGLGYLELVQTHFAPLVVAISAIESASFAEEIIAGTMTFEAVYQALAIILLLDVVLFLGPLCIFSPKLWACRVKGMSDYMEFAARYVNGFDRKWLGSQTPVPESPCWVHRTCSPWLTWPIVLISCAPCAGSR
jgi:hypothetical protein